MSWNRKMMRARSLGSTAPTVSRHDGFQKAISTSSVVLMGISANGSSVNGETEGGCQLELRATTVIRGCSQFDSGDPGVFRQRSSYSGNKPVRAIATLKGNGVVAAW